MKQKALSTVLTVLAIIIFGGGITYANISDVSGVVTNPALPNSGQTRMGKILIIK